VMHMPQGKRMSDETRIGACADYLLGKPTPEIMAKWQVSATTVSRWIKRTGSFKLRQIHKSREGGAPAEQVGR